MKKSISTIAKNVSGSAEVDAYLAALPAAQRGALQDLRQVIKKAAPEATEEINYHIPVYKQNGWLVAMAAHPSHLSFVVMREDLLNGFKADLKGYKYTGTTIRFTPEKPLPATVVTKLVKARVAENLANAKPTK